MATVITCANQKGGVAKTTTVAALAYVLKQKGNSVLCVDMDPQCNLEMVAGKGPDGKDLAIDTFDVDTKSMLNVLNGECDIGDVLIKSDLGDIARASALLYSWYGKSILSKEEYKLYSQEPEKIIQLIQSRYTNNSLDIENLTRLDKALFNIKEAYDYIIIDTNPSLSLLTMNSLYAADYVLIPANTEEFASQAIIKLWSDINSLNKAFFYKKIKIAGLLLTQYDYRPMTSGFILSRYNKMAQAYGFKLFEAKIRKSVAVPKSSIKRMNVVKFDSKSTTATDYIAFVDELLERIDLEELNNG